MDNVVHNDTKGMFKRSYLSLALLLGSTAVASAAVEQLTVSGN